ncbi:glycosyltransferase family 2 protein [Vibrio breoganii]
MYRYSIIIPHFNSNDSLNKLVSTIPLLDREDIEVIIIDDNSDVNPVDTLPFESKNLIVESNKYLKGAGGARNTGLELSKGDWILFADSDDWFTARAFDVLDSVIGANSDFDICYFTPTSFNLTNRNEGKRHRKISGLIDDYLSNPTKENKIKLNFSHYVPWTKLIKSSLVSENKLTFDETIIANDGMFSAKCSLAASKIVASRESIYCVTESNYSLTKQKKSDLLYIRVEVFSKMYNFLSKDIKKTIGMNPLALVYLASKYGIREIFVVLRILKTNNVSLVENFNLTSIKRRLNG